MSRSSEVLGPIFLYWCAQLNSKISFLNRKQPSSVLFCTRAGKRIKQQLDAYSGVASEGRSDVFPMSRILAAKVGFGHLSAFDPAFVISNENLGAGTLGEACRSFLCHFSENEHTQSLLGLKSGFNRNNMRTLLAANDASSKFLREYFNETHNATRRYVENLEVEGKNFILVDTGWKSSVQRVLAAAFPDKNFTGLYFGVMDEQFLSARHHVMFNGQSYDPIRPETCFAIHRHLIESIFEVQAESVEEMPGGMLDAVAQHQLADVTSEVVSQTDLSDRAFTNTLEYIQAHRDLPFDTVVENYIAALNELERILCFPTREEAILFSGKDRSFDFGRSGAYPVFHEKAADETYEDVIERSLWPQGQIALKYTGKIARELQKSALGEKTTKNYFSEFVEKSASPQAETKKHGWAGSVAVITRTKNRPLLLKRAMSSVASQTYSNIQWVVINDGGDLDCVREVLAKAPFDRRRITCLSNDQSVGMEAASNLAINAVDTEFVVIHDDDDYWAPSFLDVCVDFLKSRNAISANFQGVVTKSYRVSEEIRDDHVVEHGREDFHPWVSEVSIPQMAIGNFFAPISFVYRRKIYEDIGGYDEKLPVLGDWKFNLEFLARANIGFVPKPLTYYCHRDVKSDQVKGAYSNSVIGGQSLHAEYFSVVVNDLLRNPNIPASFAPLLASAHNTRIMESRFNQLDGVLKTVQNAAQATSTNEPSDETRLGDGRLQESDRQHVIHCIINASKKNDIDGQTLEWIENALNSIHRLEDTNVRQKIVSDLSRHIPSPSDFDHIEYLRRRNDLWATKFNDAHGEFVPYHHYLMLGIEEGEPRPTIS